MDALNEKLISDLDIIPVILAGGSGSRLWPLSRTSYPKQYLNLVEENKFSLLQNTYLRLKGLNNLQAPIIISNEEQRFLVTEQMREINVKPDSIILEPFGRNTAPAIALAALKASKKNKDTILLVLSSDHHIDNNKNFRKVIEDGLKLAKANRLVTFGIIPNSPETGYGYIEVCEEINDENNSSNVKSFIEKPNLEKAKNLIKDKHYFWNSGIFLFKASTILEELNKFEPDIVKTCFNSLEKGKADLDFFRINENYFKKCPNVPIDIAVMERTKLGSVLIIKAGWNDIGSWKSIYDNSEKDNKGNTLIGKVITEEVNNCYLRSEERLIVGIDLKNLIVVETNDAILISDKESTQKVKKVVQKLYDSNAEEGNNSKKNYRPWGSFSSIERGTSWQVKKLEIKPYSSISLQLHNHRSEHWIIVKGTAKIEIDDKVSFLKKNESIYVPLGSKHRLTNQTKEYLVLIEVQSGSYLGEDDIIRFADNYGRAPY